METAITGDRVVLSNLTDFLSEERFRVAHEQSPGSPGSHDLFSLVQKGRIWFELRHSLHGKGKGWFLQSFFVCPEERHFEHNPSSLARSVLCLRVLHFSHLDEMCSLEQNLQFLGRVPEGRTEESRELGGAATAATTLGLAALEWAMEA